MIAMMSRWECIVPFPSPVVPEVKAIIAMSSAAVSQFSNVASLLHISASRLLAAAFSVTPFVK